jgi:hypothetical protein
MSKTGVAESASTRSTSASHAVKRDDDVIADSSLSASWRVGNNVADSNSSRSSECFASKKNDILDYLAGRRRNRIVES